MRDLALSSSLFANGDITHVRNCVDPAIFNGRSREQTRVELGLAATSKVVLFSSANQPRKGAYIIPEVIRSLRSASPQHSWRFLFMGGLPPALDLTQDIIPLPRTTDEARVASYYAASDVYALPSLEDNLPNTIGESLSCGTPVAAFPTGGIVEMVQSGINGYLAQQVSGDALVEAIREVWTSSLDSRERISSTAHGVYSPIRVAGDHLKLFTKAAGGPAN
jgi:glycosyltransferase involved in cell wall biosynthesis